MLNSYIESESFPAKAGTQAAKAIQVTGLVDSRRPVADNAVLKQLITLILCTYWCYTQKWLGK